MIKNQVLFLKQKKERVMSKKRKTIEITDNNIDEMFRILEVSNCCGCTNYETGVKFSVVVDESEWDEAVKRDEFGRVEAGKIMKEAQEAMRKFFGDPPAEPTATIKVVRPKIFGST